MRKLVVTEFLTLVGGMEEPTSWHPGHASPERQQGGNLLVYGSGTLARTLLRPNAERPVGHEKTTPGGVVGGGGGESRTPVRKPVQRASTSVVRSLFLGSEPPTDRVPLNPASSGSQERRGVRSC